LFAFGAVAVLAVVAFSYFNLWRPEGTGPAGPTVPRAAFSKVWTTRHVALVGLGDSVTAGFGASRRHSYFDRLVMNPPDEFADMRGVCLSAVLPHLDVVNLAVSGSTSLDHIDIVRDRLKPQDPDTIGLVVMTSGGNDIIHNYGRTPPREGAMYGATLETARPWIAAYEQRLSAMLDEIATRFPGGCHVFLADIYDPTDAVGDAEHAGLPAWRDGLEVHRAYNDVIRRVAGRRSFVHVVPMYAEFLGHGIHCTQFWTDHYRPNDPHYWYADNLEDPNDRGYDAIRRLFLIEIAKIAHELAR
jgi:lysophospholipase L1-like esterase